MSLNLKHHYEAMEDHELDALSMRGNLTAEAAEVLKSEIKRRKAGGLFKPHGIVSSHIDNNQRKRIPWWMWLLVFGLLAVAKAIHRSSS